MNLNEVLYQNKIVVFHEIMKEGTLRSEFHQDNILSRYVDLIDPNEQIVIVSYNNEITQSNVTYCTDITSISDDELINIFSNKIVIFDSPLFQYSLFSNEIDEILQVCKKFVGLEATYVGDQSKYNGDYPFNEKAERAFPVHYTLNIDDSVTILSSEHIYNIAKHKEEMNNNQSCFEQMIPEKYEFDVNKSKRFIANVISLVFAWVGSLAIFTTYSYIRNNFDYVPFIFAFILVFIYMLFMQFALKDMYGFFKLKEVTRNKLSSSFIIFTIFISVLLGPLLYDLIFNSLEITSMSDLLSYLDDRLNQDYTLSNARNSSISVKFIFYMIVLFIIYAFSCDGFVNKKLIWKGNSISIYYYHIKNPENKKITNTFDLFNCVDIKNAVQSMDNLVKGENYLALEVLKYNGTYIYQISAFNAYSDKGPISLGTEMIKDNTSQYYKLNNDILMKLQEHVLPSYTESFVQINL